MNTGITSKEAILEVSRGIVASKGLSAVTMRSVADESHIALGTLYNYYANKDDLLLATVESIWADIFHMNYGDLTEMSFLKYVEYIFDCVQKSMDKYPGFFTAHSMSIAGSGREKARNVRQHCFSHMKERLLDVLMLDGKVSEDVFSTSLERSEFVDFVFDNIILLLVQNKTNCDMLKEIIQRVIY